MNEEKNVALVGLGPHAKRNYIKSLKESGNTPKLIVELESEQEKIKEYLKQENIETELFLIPTENRNDEEINEEIAKKLSQKVKELGITHSIISTEPQAHFAYLKFFIENEINVLSDKPITVVKDMDKKESVNKIKEQYNELVELYKEKKDKISCRIMCQRRFNKGYMYVMQQAEEIIKKYNIPITYINIYHCDGKWMMPHDYDTENHPYKYGYGKLFHSGYHFVDLLAEFIKLNRFTTPDKRITKVDIDSCKFDLEDDLTTMNREDILNLFKEQDIPEFYNEEIDKEKYENYGEKDFYSLMQFKNKEGRVITTANLNMLQNGFSRRAWINTKEDMYKGNGRIRHETVNIQIGPLANIQIHSYQSKEIKDRQDFETEQKIGGLEHFDINIFRNSELIGGKTFEQINLSELYEDIDKEEFNGYNELSREEFIKDFLEGKSTKSDLLEHSLGIELLYEIALELGEKENKRDKKNKEGVEHE